MLSPDTESYGYPCGLKETSVADCAPISAWLASRHISAFREAADDLSPPGAAVELALVVDQHHLVAARTETVQDGLTSRWARWQPGDPEPNASVVRRGLVWGFMP